MNLMFTSQVKVDHVSLVCENNKLRASINISNIQVFFTTNLIFSERLVDLKFVEEMFLKTAVSHLINTMLSQSCVSHYVHPRLIKHLV